MNEGGDTWAHSRWVGDTKEFKAGRILFSLVGPCRLARRIDTGRVDVVVEREAVCGRVRCLGERARLARRWFLSSNVGSRTSAECVSLVHGDCSANWAF